MKSSVAVAYIAHLCLPLLLLIDELVAPHLSSYQFERGSSDKIVLAVSALWLLMGLGILLFRKVRTRLLMIVGKPLLSYYAIIFALVCVELLARMGWKEFYSYPGVWIPDSKFSYVADPKQEPGVEGLKRFTVNELGLRGPVFPHGNNSYKIITVGGSTTECFALDDSEEWPHLLMEGMNSRQSKRPVWVGNAGVSGHTTVDHLAVLKILPIFDEADLVIILIGINDLGSAVSLGGAPTERELRLRAASVVAALSEAQRYPYFKRLRIYELTRSVISGKLPKLKPQSVNFSIGTFAKVRSRRAQAPLVRLPDLRIGLEEYRGRIERLSQVCKSAKKRCLFLTQPTMWRSDLSLAEQQLLWFGWVDSPPSDSGENVGKLTGYVGVADLARAMDEYNAALLNVCHSERLECYDLASKVPKSASAFYDDCHFNEGGARIVARALADYLASAQPFSGPN